VADVEDAVWVAGDALAKLRGEHASDAVVEAESAAEGGGRRSWWEVRCADGSACSFPGSCGYTWEDFPDQPYQERAIAVEVAQALDSAEYSCGHPATCGPHQVVQFVEAPRRRWRTRG
jgi:hypothetical protein